MNLKSNNLNLLFIISFFIFWFNICISQENNSVTAKSDTSSTVKSDSLISAISPKEAHWNANAQETAVLIAEDISDFVQVLPNVFSLDLGSLGQFSPLTFRGSTPQESAVFVDGLVFEDPIQGFLNSNVIPINFIENMTFRGAGALLPFGELAPAGILHINTYQFQASKPYSKVTFRAGDWGYSDIGITFGLPLTQSSSFLIGGSRQELKGFIFNSGHVGSKIHSQISFYPHENFALRYAAFINKDNVKVPFPLIPDFVPPVLNSTRNENRFDQYLSIKTGNLAKNNNQIQGRLFFSRLLQESSGDTLLFKNRNLTLGVGIQYDRKAGNHWFSFGGEFKIYDLNSLHLGDHSNHFGRLFARDVYRFTKNWALGIQARLEKHDDYSIALNPSGQLYYELSPRSKIWIGLQSARRYPSFAERYWPTQSFRGNPNLTSEKGTASEIGFRMKAVNNVKFEAALFRHQMREWIGRTLLPDSVAFGPANLGHRTIHGVDIKFIWNYLPGGQFGFIGTFLQVEEDALEKQLEVPEFSIYSYLEMGHSFFEDYVYVTLRLVGRFIGKRYGLIYNMEGSILPEIISLGETALLDGKLTFQFTDASIFISMENLFDRRYQLVPGFFMPPKTFRFGIVWEFWD
ncbi:MAG: TonB-dependent receptor domain-containing protein [bacterium]